MANRNNNLNRSKKIKRRKRKNSDGNDIIDSVPLPSMKERIFPEVVEDPLTLGNPLGLFD